MSLKNQFLALSVFMLMLGIMFVIVTIDLYSRGILKNGQQWYIMIIGNLAAFLCSGLAFNSYKTSK